MGNAVTGLTRRGSKLTWRCRGREAVRTFARPVRNALPLSDGSGLAVVLEPPDSGGQNEACLLNGDGSLRCRVVIPPEAGEYLYIDGLFYEGEGVAFALVVRDGWYDVACVFDNDGRFLRCHFTK